MSEIDDRRQRATETFFDEVAYHRRSGLAQDLQEAIEVATQVKITSDIEDAYIKEAYGSHEQVTASITAGLIAAFRAAGFEVVE